MKNDHSESRRKFLYNLGLAGLSIPLISATGTCNNEPKKQKTMSAKKDKLGIALVGLGGYATGQLAPALQQTEHCYLAGIVTGTPSKAVTWKEKYNIPEKNIYNYENYDSIKDNPDIDIIYVVLPNNMHAEYTIRGLEAGKHVICEKPMAIKVEDCDKMIAAAEKANKFLSIGYRLQYDSYNLEMVRLVKEKVYGEVKSIETTFSIMPDKGEWRLNKKIAGGGPLMDVGIYCMQAICYLLGTEPVAVTAETYPVSDKEKFLDIEETLDFQMEMPGGIIGKCRSSYSEAQCFLQVNCERGWFRLEPAFYYGGIKFSSSDGHKFETPPFSQQARQMDAMALAAKKNQASITPGEMGLRDMKIIEAIYEAMYTGKRVLLKK
jgi:predicted dehydrogenase